MWMLGPEPGSFWVIALALLLILFSIQIGLNASAMCSISTEGISVSYTVEFSISILKWYKSAINNVLRTSDPRCCSMWHLRCRRNTVLSWGWLGLGIGIYCCNGKGFSERETKILKINHGETKVWLSQSIYTAAVGHLNYRGAEWVWN